MNANAPALFARSRELARSQLAAGVAAALGRLPGDLERLAAAATVPAEARILDDAMRVARLHRDAMAAAFERALLAAFDRKIRPPARPSAAAAEPTLDQLTLVDDAAMELEIALGRLVRKTADEVDAQQVAGVRARLGELAGGRAFEGSDNPLGPETALEALKSACDAAPAEGPVRMALVNSLQPHVALALRRLYADLNEMLIQAGVLPRIRHDIQRAPNSLRATAGSGGGGGGGPGAPGAAPMSTGGVAGMPAMGGMPPGMTLSQAMSLKDLLPSATGSPIDVGAIVAAMLDGPAATSRQYGARMLANPAGSLFDRAMAVPANAEVLAQLTQLQGAVMVGPAPGAGPGAGDLAAVVQHLARMREHPLDQLTGELVAVVFDFLLHDRELPEAVRMQLARLQIVAFKAALLDRSFFARREHPLRLLLAAIADAAADPRVDTGPEGRFALELKAIVDEVVATFESDLGVFTAAQAKLRGLTAELAAEGDREVEALAPELVEAERVEEVRRRARIEIAGRLTGVAPQFVRRFLTDTWVHAVADASAHARTGSDAWEARLELVDDLLWSVTAKLPTDVSRLTQLLPKLVPGLTRGMKAVDVPPEGQRAFLDELMRTHAALLQAVRGKRPVPAEVAAPPSLPAAAEVEFDAAADLDADAMLGIERGAVVEFADVDPAVRARLSWISPKRTLYLFTAHGAKARQIAPADLRTALREGRARLVEEGGAAVERALAAVVSESR
jgi:hypothetical protein